VRADLRLSVQPWQLLYEGAQALLHFLARCAAFLYSTCSSWLLPDGALLQFVVCGNSSSPVGPLGFCVHSVCYVLFVHAVAVVSFSKWSLCRWPLCLLAV
jgi:hypothetical protein